MCGSCYYVLLLTYLLAYLLTYVGPAPMLAAGHYVLLLFCFSFFCRLISDVAWSIVTKLCYTFDDPNLQNSVSNLGAPTNPPEQIRRPKNIKIRRLDHEHFHQMENGVANCDHFRTYVLNSMNKRRKINV